MTLFKVVRNSLLLYKLKIKGHWRFYFFMKKHGGCYSLNEVATYLHISMDEVTAMASNNQLLCFKLYFRQRFPIFQFHDHKVILGFDVLIQRIKYSSPYSKIRFFLAQDIELGMSLIEALRSNYDINLLLEKANNFDMYTG